MIFPFLEHEPPLETIHLASLIGNSSFLKTGFVLETIPRSDHVFPTWLWVQLEKPFPERSQSFRDGMIKHKTGFDPMG